MKKVCVVTALALVAMSGTTQTTTRDTKGPGDKGIYIGLSYSPAWNKIRDFDVGAHDGSTVARYPYLPGEKTMLSSSFNWRVQDPKIQFRENTDWAMEGSIGYRKNGARIEVELGYEKFEVRGFGPGGKYARTETIHLLAKELAHDVVSGKTEKLGYALAETSPHDIAAFAQAVGRTSQDIDSKVCNKKVAVDDYNTHSTRGDQVGNADVTTRMRSGNWSCVDYVDDGNVPWDAEKGRAALRGDSRLSTRFGDYNENVEKGEDHGGDCQRVQNSVYAVLLGRGRVKDVCAHDTTGDAPPQAPGVYLDWGRWWTGKETNHGWPGTAEGKINTAQGMAGDLVGNLNNDEKDTVAQILTKNVSGAEVVEIRAVTTTSVLTNVCYDLRYKKTLTPFGCAGFGANLISVTDGHVAARLAYKLKAGLSYNVTPRVTAFVSGYYHQVLGDGEYYDIPLQHLRDDRSPEGRSNNYALAKFEMAYVGAEIGMRFAFK